MPNEPVSLALVRRKNAFADALIQCVALQISIIRHKLIGSHSQVNDLKAYCDFTIIHGEKTYRVHRLVLATHSNYFQRLFAPGFQDAREHIITLHEDSELAVRMMMQYFRTLDRKVTSISDDVRHLLCAHSAVFAIADKYLVSGLKDVAFDKFVDEATSMPVAFEGNSNRERLAAVLLKAVPHVFLNTPPADDRLRKWVVNRFLERENELLKRCGKASFDKVVREVPEFASEMLLAVTSISLKD